MCSGIRVQQEEVVHIHKHPSRGCEVVTYPTDERSYAAPVVLHGRHTKCAHHVHIVASLAFCCEVAPILAADAYSPMCCGYIDLHAGDCLVGQMLKCKRVSDIRY
eukprot:2359265-Amphidinium_carterae.2